MPDRRRNPPERPIWLRNRAALRAQAVLEAHAEELIRKLIEQAMNGNTAALRLCVERLPACRPMPGSSISLRQAADPANAIDEETTKQWIQ
jgi:hypothetical protein